ncbi:MULTISPECIES: serine/threonine-protein kinase, partial [unclassified Streptomyces]
MDELRPQDPSRIGAYRLVARLGAGGMGQVFLGRSPGGRLVAVKVIRDEISDHPEAMARFRREVATVRTVRSAWTAQLVDASLDAPPYWLATEYVAGPTLRQAVEESGPFPPGGTVRLAAALAEGLAAVHAHGVTHRDLKPQNVILAPQGPQLIDFGIARGLDQTVLTREGMASGTPGFAAPEVVRHNEAGPAADVFALGATLAYTATGRPPYGTGDPAVVSYRAVHEDIDLDGVEGSLAGLIRSCVAKAPADRPSPAEVIARCAVDSALALDPHYRSLALGPRPRS